MGEARRGSQKKRIRRTWKGDEKRRRRRRATKREAGKDVRKERRY